MSWRGKNGGNGGAVGIPQQGSHAFSAIAAGTGGVSFAVTFSTPFSAVPTIHPSVNDTRINVALTSVSTTGFTIICANWTSAASGAFTVKWTAILV